VAAASILARSVLGFAIPALPRSPSALDLTHDSVYLLA
jgi:hypothetical protein